MSTQPSTYITEVSRPHSWLGLKVIGRLGFPAKDRRSLQSAQVEAATKITFFVRFWDSHKCTFDIEESQKEK